MADERRERARFSLPGATGYYGSGNGVLNRDLFGLANFAGQSARSDYVNVDGRWYRDVDTAQSNRLVPVFDPWRSATELAAKRGAIERVSYIEENPLGGVGYGGAALLGASPETRDLAVLAGGTIGSGLLAGRPLGVRTGTRAPAPSRQPPNPSLPREPVRYGSPNSTRQASYGNATVTERMIGTGAEARRGLKPPGWKGDGKKFKQDRGHLIAANLGGVARTPAQAVTLDQSVNRGAMNQYEAGIAGRARNGEVIEYFVVPLYQAPGAAPSSMVLSANGSRGGFTPVLLANAPRRPR